VDVERGGEVSADGLAIRERDAACWYAWPISNREVSPIAVDEDAKDGSSLLTNQRDVDELKPVCFAHRVDDLLEGVFVWNAHG